MLSGQNFEIENFLFSQVTNQMQEKIDDRLSWLTQHLGGTGDKLALVTTCLLHAGYFLLATLCILFLNAPLFTRLVLLVMVPINAWSEIHFHSSLSYSSLSCLLTFALLGKLPEVLMSCSLLLFPPLNSLSNQVITSLPVVPPWLERGARGVVGLLRSLFPAFC